MTSTLGHAGARPSRRSAEQIAPHHTAHYGGALKALVAADANYGLSLRTVDPQPNLREAIERRFGSVDKWSADFVASAREAAGWAMLVKHPVNGKLYNVVSDEHAMGVLWMAAPIVVVDTYEHAFYIDYQNRKAEYVEKFLAHIDWAEANSRFGGTD